MIDTMHVTRPDPLFLTPPPEEFLALQSGDCHRAISMVDPRFALTWVDCFNHRRLVGSIGHVPSAEHEPAYHRKTRRQAIRA